MADGDPVLFRDRHIAFSNGSVGKPLGLISASPANYWQVISDPASMPAVNISGQLFIPSGNGQPLVCVIIAPGSLGVAESHIAHAEALTDAGHAAFILDSFGAREVTSTVADQTQFSFAASAYDVLAAYRHLAELPEIDHRRIGAQGHSRGGTAVLMAATRDFADAVVGPDRGLFAAYAAYPWSGHQFLRPAVGAARVRAIIGDADDWCSPMQVQAHMHGIRLSGGHASFRLVPGARHSFDRGPPVIDVPEASVSPAAPIAYVDRDGAFLHPLKNRPDPQLQDRDLMVYGLKAGFGRKGASIGGTEAEASLFRADMREFWERVIF